MCQVKVGFGISYLNIFRALVSPPLSFNVMLNVRHVCRVRNIKRKVGEQRRISLLQRFKYKKASVYREAFDIFATWKFIDFRNVLEIWTNLISFRFGGFNFTTGEYFDVSQIRQSPVSNEAQRQSLFSWF